MTAVVESKRTIVNLGGIKIIVIETDATAATGHTIDLNTDIADGKGQVVKSILNTILQDDAGADKDGTWNPATGIYTLGTISTGIHNLTIIAR
jgi:hypothetical protein